MRYLLILVFALLSSTIAVASTIRLELDDSTTQMEFQKEFVTVYVDSMSRMSINEIRQQDFVNFEGAFINKNVKSSYWLYFPITSDFTKAQKWVLEVLDSHHDLIELYVYRHDSLIYEAKAGQLVSATNKIYSHKNHVVDFPINSQDQLDCYIKFKSSIPGSLIFKLRSNSDFASYALKEYYFLGIYYGVLFLIALLNLVMCLTIKKRIYLYYLIYVLAWMWLSMIDDGIGKHLFWQESTSVNKLGYLLAVPLLLIFYVFYARLFFNVKEHFQKEGKQIYVVTGLFVLSHVLQQFLNIPATIPNLLLIASLLMILGVAYKSYNQGFLPARFFILGNVFIILGLFVRFLQDQQVIRFTAYDTVPAIMAVYSRNIGMMFEIIALTIALGDRFRFLKSKNEEHQKELLIQYEEREHLQKKMIQQLEENELLKDKVNRELENKVRERTVQLHAKGEELEKANLQLKEQADKINEMNRLLDLDNYKLKKAVKEVHSQRIMFKDITFEEFKSLYPDRFSVLKHLNEHKWKTEYTCKKCGNTKYCDGNTKFARRCTKCRYDESVTAYTIFHKCKFPLDQAMYIVSKTIRQEKDLNVQEVSDELGLRKNTVWNFRAKVLDTMLANKKSRNSDDFINVVILNPVQESN